MTLNIPRIRCGRGVRNTTLSLLFSVSRCDLGKGARVRSPYGVQGTKIYFSNIRIITWYVHLRLWYIWMTIAMKNLCFLNAPNLSVDDGGTIPDTNTTEPVSPARLQPLDLWLGGQPQTLISSDRLAWTLTGAG